VVGGPAGRTADPRIDRLRAELAAHRPIDVAEQRSCEELLDALRSLAAPFDERADATHVTGSAIVIDGAGNVVLHRHKQLGIWLQPGGHVDGGETPAEAARRETVEETGLRAGHPGDTATLLHVDAHPGPRGHRHLDVRYLLVADPDSPLRPAAGESPDVAWLPVSEAIELADASLASALSALRAHEAGRIV
jgi:8-oxo-dGTP pyrophosphatase MutT (NUDIX family)